MQNLAKRIGNYIVDFYIASSKIVIEPDGSQHYEDKGIENDTKRDAFLNDLGIKALRYSKTEVNQRFDSVCEDILNHTNTSSVNYGCNSFMSVHLGKGVCDLGEYGVFSGQRIEEITVK